MRVAVAGASGLIGSAVARRLCQDAEVVSIGRRAGSDLRCDFTDPASVEALDLSGLDALIHCAGVIDEDFEVDPAAALRHATLGAAALFGRAVQGGVRRVAYISSAHIYGPLRGIIDETRPSDPRSDYALAHVATEQSLRRVAGSFAACAVFRPCAVFSLPPSLGAFRRWSLIQFAFPRDAVERGGITLTSSGEQRRNFVAADDVAHAVTGWLMDDRAGFESFNPVGRETLSVWDFAKLCAQEAERIIGKPVALNRLADHGAAAAPLEYRTATRFCRGEADLTGSIAALMRRIVAEGGG